MKFAIAIETKDRRLRGMVNYLGVTLENLQSAGVFTSPYLRSLCVVSGGDLPDFYASQVQGRPVEWVPCPDEGCTRQQNAQRAIQAATNAAHEGDWVIKLEDDIDVIRDFLGSVARWVDAIGDANTPMLSLGATFQNLSTSHYEPGETILRPGPSFPNVRQMLAHGLFMYPHPVQGFWGAQALMWRKSWAQHLATWLGPDPALFDGKEYHRERGHDLLLQVWGQAIGAHYFGCAIPSFVQHIGRQSNLTRPDLGHVQPFFEFPWPGRDWSFEGVKE